MMLRVKIIIIIIFFSIMCETKILREQKWKGIYFLHNRKCAGSAVGSIFRKWFRENSNCCRTTTKMKSCANAPHWWMSNPIPNAENWGCPDLHFREMEFGCINSYVYNMDNVLKVTSLRDPIERHMSMFYYEGKPWQNFYKEQKGQNHSDSEIFEWSMKNESLWFDYIYNSVQSDKYWKRGNYISNYYVHRFAETECNTNVKKHEFIVREKEKMKIDMLTFNKTNEYRNNTVIYNQHVMVNQVCFNCMTSGEKILPTEEGAYINRALAQLEKFQIILFASKMVESKLQSALDNISSSNLPPVNKRKPIKIVKVRTGINKKKPSALPKSVYQYLLKDNAMDVKIFQQAMKSQEIRD